MQIRFSGQTPQRPPYPSKGVPIDFLRTDVLDLALKLRTEYGLDPAEVTRVIQETSTRSVLNPERAMAEARKLKQQPD